MNMKATALTATTVAIASLLPSMGETNVQTANAEQLSNVKTGYVKVDQVALHTKDNTNSSSIDTIRFNTKVNILETTNDWYKVSVNNKVGYVQKDSILLKNKLQSNNQYIVNANALNVRSEPNLEASILDVLPNGKFVTIQEEQGEWYKILHNGKTGYVQKAFVSNGSQPLVKGITVQNNTKYTVATPKLNVRSNASTSSALLGSLQNGTQLQVVETVGTWYKIRFGTGYGYVAKHYVMQNQTQSQAQTTQPTSIPAVFKFPTQGRISSTFDIRWEQMHYGIDIAAQGNVSIQAAAAGKVVKSYYSASYGNVVFIAHQINGKLYTTVYAHMKDRTVQAGDQVQAGQLVGHMGNTGHSYGQHLHFELHNGEWNFEKTNAVNPLPYLVR
ncbi:SH3 domain-containing protein [Bacillus cereus]|uniref:SH3 domain-containing protein n=1 Tax=Bacillus TaxID=1386 RepID=UPI000B4B4C18|nr:MULTISPECIES: SH3 domain-containing protein [Bacillus cereus group]MDA1581805.1 SH3 domain-containing protein [Bacillus cereus group sp. TH228LC]MEC2921219.1 SH3 domain-containing protein [Bacillus tropicus]MEC2924856.1 SH3 domain-containing protein [Bacillus tropicus]MEC2954823.1 SH3 domain-containing protein [Bacillus tropicus]MEC3048200.1 SH3 domain-containing protein [Bacillus tropicus]